MSEFPPCHHMYYFSLSKLEFYASFLMSQSQDLSAAFYKAGSVLSVPTSFCIINKANCSEGV